MARVTSDEVKAIIEIRDTTLAASDLSPFIDTASILVDTHLLDSDLSDSLLKAIELWLSGHFVKIRDKETSREELGTAREYYDYMTRMGLSATKEGQQAMMLDSTGSLARYNKMIENGEYPKSVSMYVFP